MRYSLYYTGVLDQQGRMFGWPSNQYNKFEDAFDDICFYSKRLQTNLEWSLIIITDKSNGKILFKNGDYKDRSIWKIYLESQLIELVLSNEIPLDIAKTHMIKNEDVVFIKTENDCTVCKLSAKIETEYL